MYLVVVGFGVVVVVVVDVVVEVVVVGLGVVEVVVDVAEVVGKDGGYLVVMGGVRMMIVVVRNVEGGGIV